MLYTSYPTLNFQKLLEAFRFEDADHTFYSHLSNLFPNSTVLNFNYARSAFRFAVRKLDVKKIIMPAFLCDVFTDILIEEKVKPVFVDVELESYNIDAAKVEEAMSRDIDAILAVHAFGMPCNLDALMDLKEDYGAILIEDCALSLGARYKRKLTGTIGDLAIFSMYKSLPTLTGGFLLINSDDIKSKIGRKSMEEESINIPRLVYSLKYFHPLLFRMREWNLLKKLESNKKVGSKKKVEMKGSNELTKALFCLYIKDYMDSLDKRRRVAEWYKKALDIDGISHQKVCVGCHPSWYNYTVRLEDYKKRDEIISRMQRKGIVADKMWHDAVVFERRIKLETSYPNTVKLSRSALNLPISDFSREDVNFIVSCLDLP